MKTENKLFVLIKQYKIFLLVIAACILAAIFHNYLVEILLSIFGLGAASVAYKASQAKEAEIISDEHERLMGQSVAESAREMLKADELRNEALKKAESIKPLPPTPKLDKKKNRKKFTSQ